MKKLIIIFSILFSLTTYGASLKFVKGNDLEPTDRLSIYMLAKTKSCFLPKSANQQVDCSETEIESREFSPDEFFASHLVSVTIPSYLNRDYKFKHLEIKVSGGISPSCLTLENQLSESKDATITVYKDSCIVS